MPKGHSPWLRESAVQEEEIDLSAGRNRIWSRIKTTFPSSLAARGVYVARFFPMGHKGKIMCAFYEVLLKEKRMPFCPVYLSAGWNVDLMAGTIAAILDYEIEAACYKQRSTRQAVWVPSDSTAVITAVDYRVCATVMCSFLH